MSEQIQSSSEDRGIWCPGCHATHPKGVGHCPNCGYRFEPVVKLVSQMFGEMLGEGKMEIKTEDRDGVEEKEENEWLHVGGRSVVG